MTSERPTILFINEQPQKLHDTDKILDTIDIDIVHASSTQEAMILLVNFSFFLILIDVSTGHTNAAKIATKVFSHPQTTHIPILFLTHINNQDGIESYENGTVDFLYKPVKRQMLTAKIKVFKELCLMRCKIKNDQELLKKQKKELSQSIKLFEKQETELTRSKEMAEKANLTKTQFLANMSHEIRTPLNAIAAYTEMLMDDELSREQREMMEIVHSSSHTLLELINDILDFSKIESGQLVLAKNPLNLFELCKEVEANFSILSKYGNTAQTFAYFRFYSIYSSKN